MKKYLFNPPCKDCPKYFGNITHTYNGISDSKITYTCPVLSNMQMYEYMSLPMSLKTSKMEDVPQVLIGVTKKEEHLCSNDSSVLMTHFDLLVRWFETVPKIFSQMVAQNGDLVESVKNHQLNKHKKKQQRHLGLSMWINWWEKPNPTLNTEKVYPSRSQQFAPQK